MARRSTSRDAILDAALELAEARHWEKLRLHDVAVALEVPLAAIHRHYPDKEALVDAWWDRADEAMLADAGRADYAALHPREKILRSVFAWLRTFDGRRRVLREMIAVRLEPGHLHIQIPSLIRLSRTVQWLREAAGRDAVFLQRALEEAALTSIFSLTVLDWLRRADGVHDPSRARLARLLDRAATAGRWLGWPASQLPPTTDRKA